ncbi:MAG: aspartate dehydrogenase [Bradyrhizobium sp.]
MDWSSPRVSAQNPEKHQGWLGKLATPAPRSCRSNSSPMPPTSLSNARPGKLLRSIVAPFVTRGKTAIVLSAGALLDNEDLIALAKQNGGQIVVPTRRADRTRCAVTAAAVETIHSVRMVTRKPVQGLAGAPLYRRKQHRHRTGITEPLRIFEGTAREAAKGFPANLNVAVALSLAGIGPDRTRLEIWADPTVTRNIHRVEVGIRFSAFFDVDREHPVGESEDGAHHRALSVIAYLRKLRSALRVGT